MITEVPPNSSGFYSNGVTQKVCLRKQGVSVSGTSLRSEHSPSDFYLHHLGISVIPYLDDWLVHHPDHQVLLQYNQAQLLDKLDLVGFILNRKKSELDLVQDIQFLGIRLRLDSGEAFLPEPKAWKIVARACDLSSLRILSCQCVSQFMGSLNWASGLIPLGRLYLRPLQRYFHSLGLTDWFTPPRQSDPSVLASLLQQWQDLSGIPIRPFQAEFTIFMDASTQGWGAHMGDYQISGTWAPRDHELHINCLELKAIGAALHHWATVLQGHHITIATDNSTVVSYIIKQGGTWSHTLLCLVVELFMWLQAQNIVVRARHIPGCLNVIADHLSHPNQPITTEWSLNPEIVSRILGFGGTPVVDMFATVSYSSLPQFMSPIPEPRALAVDALSQDWQGRSMYMFPPFPLLSKVIQKLGWIIHYSFHTTKISCLNRTRDTSRTENRTVCTPWRLSCDTTKQQAFQMRSLGLPQHLGNPQPIACMTFGVFASLDGPQGRDLIHLVPQLLK